MNTAAMPVYCRIADLPSAPGLPLPRNAPQPNRRTLYGAMDKWSGHYGSIFLTQARPLTAAASLEVMAFTMPPVPPAISLRQRDVSAIQGKSNSPVNAYANS